MGAVVLANALKANTALLELHMKGNELGDSGTTAICDALKGGWRRSLCLCLCPWTWTMAGRCQGVVKVCRIFCTGKANWLFDCLHSAV